MRSYRFVLSAVFLFGLTLLSAGNTAVPGETDSGNAVKLEKLTWAQFQKRLANPHARYTMVDAWSTTCGPCKENFPHVIAMHRKYGGKGLAVISLSLDDPSDKDAVAEAEKFLKEKKAVFTNVLLDDSDGDGFDKLNINAIPAVFLYGSDGKEVKRFTMDDPSDKGAVTAAEQFLKDKRATFTNVLLDEPFPDGFDKLNINAIPAVFLYGSDGKEVKRFTMDDPDNQFTYEDVEKTVAGLLGGQS